MKTICTKLDTLVDMQGNSDFIDNELAELQKMTAAKIIKILEDRPGIILGDDVGMGKTYMAIAAVYYHLSLYPKKPVLIVTPSWMLREKWVGDLRKFIERNDKQGALTEEDILNLEKGSTFENLKAFIKGSEEKKVVVVPVNIFTSGGWKLEKSFLFNCWFRHRSLRGKTRENIMKKLVYDSDMVANPLEVNNMWTSYELIPASAYERLDEAFDENDMSYSRINSGLEYLRYQAMNARLPEFSLFVLDEAHKVKNPDTKRHQALTNMLREKYIRSLFLTATPFQLSEDELFTVLKLFENANIPEVKRRDFSKDCELLKISMLEFVSAVYAFEKVWNSMRPDEEQRFYRSLEEGDIDKEISGDEGYSLHCYKEALNKKAALQEVMVRFVIRNVKDKNKYRMEIIGGMKTREKDSIAIGGEHFIPFALWEKTIYEIFKKNESTFVSTVKQSFTSSYEALEVSSLYNKNDDLEALNTLKKLRPYVRKHPKMEELADNITLSLESNEKTLVFCRRVETAHAMKKRLEKIYNRKQKRSIEMLFPEKSEEAFKNYHKRFYNKQDSAWYYLQENYIQSLLQPILNGQPHGITAEQILDEVNKSYRKYNRTKKTNLMYLKRIVEQIVIREAIYRNKIELENLEEAIRNTIENILAEEYVELGLNLNEDDYEKEEGEESGFEIKNISVEMIDRFMRYKGIWTIYENMLNKLNPEDRDAVVEGLIRFMQRDKSFFIALKKLENKKPSKKRFDLIPEVFSQGGEFNWSAATERFLGYYIKATKEEKRNMLSGLRESSIVAVISGEVQDSSRERIKDGFNTPFYPKVLISLPLAQEGIDLQKECRRVIHYDLDWNPASLEQRVGRIDRINSLISRINPDGDLDPKLEIYYPYIKNTIDESIYRTVKAREKWFSFILGGTPDWDSFSIDEDTRPLPENICKSLQIDLAVI